MFDQEKHKSILVAILKDIYLDGGIAPHLGFKGGTAALLFYGLDRFSVDLDFDLLDHEVEDEVFGKVGKIARKYGTLGVARKKRYTLFFLISYGSVDRNVKIEINRRETASRYEILDYFGIRMQVIVKEDMFANKLMALSERVHRANRDIYDTWFFLQHQWSINKQLVEKRAGLPFVEFLSVCIERLEAIPERTILSGMGELLNERQKVWAKQKLKSETLFFLRTMQANQKET